MSYQLRYDKTSESFIQLDYYYSKGTEAFIRTPRLDLQATGPEFISSAMDFWYHLAYTLSDSEKRLDIYSEWVGFYCIQTLKRKDTLNDGPLYIGRSFDNGFNGEICNVRYFNWRLCAEEMKDDFLYDILEFSLHEH
ncbi:10238_t:CDS:2 [Funneliformis caledonium]|uniref:10238_t:CDS:1 n=1 Tax=Funneliformis caledonium TaxID=1117310 RepID=A0A9N9FYN1_9GLOM|nr:10238_t:CDS:2 [Funneliformis caledonium]